MRVKRKVDAALKRRIASYNSARPGIRFARVSDSPKNNHEMHMPGSQNRRKGYHV